MGNSFEDMAANTKTNHQRLELMHSKAASQNIHDSVLDRKRAWILMMSSTIPLDFFDILSKTPHQNQ